MTVSTSEPTIHELFSLTNKVSLVTGASGHLGGAMARALAEAGSRVIVTSRDRPRAERVAEELTADGRLSHVGVSLDQLNTESVERGFAEAVDRVGQIDVLVNNAHEVLTHDWTNVTGEEFNRQLANVTGYFLLARLVRNHAAARRAPASIILLSSMYGVVGSYPSLYDGIGPASPAAYHALKGGITHLARHLAIYWAADGVRVNCLSPGPFLPSKVPISLAERYASHSPMKRIGQPHELKGAIVFLASDASSYMTGQNLIVDGGWTAW